MDKFVTLEGAELLYDNLRGEISKAEARAQEQTDLKADYLRVTEDGLVYLVSGGEGGEDIAGPFGPFAGGGGGGGGGGGDDSSTVTLTNKNKNGWKKTDVPEGTPVYIYLSWSSVDKEGDDTGPGTYTVKVNNIIRETIPVNQGDFSVRVNDYFTTGSNRITITVTDANGKFQSLGFTVNFLEYSLYSTSFDASTPKKNAIPFFYYAIGVGTKNVHFFMDGNEFITKVITNDRENNITIPKESEFYPEDFQWHGHHEFKAYFDVQDTTIVSSVLYYDIACYDEDNPTPIILSQFRDESIMTYDTLRIPYKVFSTEGVGIDVEYFIDGNKVGSEAIDFDKEVVWAQRIPKFEHGEDYNDKLKGENHTFTIKCGEVSRDFIVFVKDLDINIEAETANLVLHLSSEGRRKGESEETRDKWEYGDIAAEFNHFNWITDGWQMDDEGIPVMRLKDDCRITIPYKPFDQYDPLNEEKDIKAVGRTYEFEFSTSSVFDYETEIISCMADGIGFSITAQRALLSFGTSRISSQYKEDEHVRISFVVSKRSNYRFIYCYINGIISGVVRYTDNESMYQRNPVNITIGSNNAIVDLYGIRIYNADLSRFQMVNNWIADMQNGEELLKQYNQNNIYGGGDLIDFTKLKKNLPKLPYLVIETNTTTDKKGNPVGHLPTYKGEKLLCNGYYVNPVEPRLSFSWKNGEIDVQGTSSQAYPIKNFKLKIKRSDEYGTSDDDGTACSGFIMTQASLSQEHPVFFKKYSMRGYSDYTQFEKGKESNGYVGPLSIPTNTFVFKADYASSEGANNVELVRYYNDMSDYKTPPQVKDSRVRQGIDGFPMVWFGNDGDRISFIGKYNFNNHKGTDEVYGFNYGGETYKEDAYSKYHKILDGASDESWEVCDNNTELTLWKRYAGYNVDGTRKQKTILTDEFGRKVTYDSYLENKTDSLARVKNECLGPLYNGTYLEEHIPDMEKYNEYLEIWRNAGYADVDAWITNLLILQIHNAGGSLDDDIQEQRNFVIDIMKSYIKRAWSLTEGNEDITIEEDLLGERGLGEEVAHDFEARFPSEWYDAHTEGKPSVVEPTRFQELQKWVASTNQDEATNKPLSEVIGVASVTYGDDPPYEFDSKEYRLAKFKNEFERYFNKDSTLFYYIFTELFLMIDSRVKNAFPTYFSVNHKIYVQTEEGALVEEDIDYFSRTGENTYTAFNAQVGDPAIDGSGNRLYMQSEEEDTEEITWADGRVTQWPKGRWCWIPYDMDTAIGINNEGLLVFDYSLEDTEGLKGNQVVSYKDPEGTPVYNGSKATLWVNFREAFPKDIKNKYKDLRVQALNYNTIEKRFEDHQNLWPAAIYNEDAYYKYLKPLIGGGQNRLGMCLGSKEQQRKWWLYNRFRFLDSKYAAGNAVGDENEISFRVNGLSENPVVSITPYTDMYVQFRQGQAWESEPVKTYRKQRATIHVNVPTAGDTEAYLRSASQIMKIEGLNQNLHISTLELAPAINLQELDLSSPGVYPEGGNRTLSALKLGSNKLLRKLDARNCYALGDINLDYADTSVDLSHCDQLEEAYFSGTLLKEVTLPTGGRLRKIWLPDTITTLNIENQLKIEEIKICNMQGEESDPVNLSTLIIENVSHDVQQKALSIIEGLPSQSNLSFKGFNINVNTVTELLNFLHKIDDLKGTGGSTTATLSGTIKVLTKAEREEAGEEDVPEDEDIMSWEDYNFYTNKYKGLSIRVRVRKTIKFYNYNDNPDEVLPLYRKEVVSGNDELSTVRFIGNDPERNRTLINHYTFNGWATERYGEAVFSQDENGVVTGLDKSYNLFSAFYEQYIYTVNFRSYDNTIISNAERIGDGDVSFTGSFPSWGETPVIGWGLEPYGENNVESSNDFRTLINVQNYIVPTMESPNLDVYCALDWPIEASEQEPSLVVVTPPNKIDYYSTERFEPEGLVINARRNTASGIRYVPTTKYYYNDVPFNTTDNSITISVDYSTVSGVETASVDLPIGMAVSAEWITKPTKKLYERNNSVDTTGASIKVTFSNGDEQILDSGLKVHIWIDDDWEETEDDKLPNTGEISVKLYYCNISVTYTVFVIEHVDDILENNTWQTISYISDGGFADYYWDVGDEKKVNVSVFRTYTTTESRQRSSSTLTFRIVAFDHNMELESPGQHTVTFGLASRIKTSETYEAGIGYISMSDYTISNEDSLESYSDGGLPVHMSLESFENALPSDLREYLKTVRKYQREFHLDDISQEPKTYPGNIIGHEDVKLFIPSAYEIYGTGKVYSGSSGDMEEADESECCEQFEYYRGHQDDPEGEPSLRRFKENFEYRDAKDWWLRSINKVQVDNFNDGTANPWLTRCRPYYCTVKGDGQTLPSPNTDLSFTYSRNTVLMMVPFFNV